MKSARRKSIREKVRSRGKSNSGLWLVYSEKMKKDLILQSARELVHWLIYLELDREVVSFDHDVEKIISNDVFETRATEPDAIVQYSSGDIAWHEVKAVPMAQDRSQLIAQASASQKNDVQYNLFTDTELKPHTHLASRYLKLMGYVEVIRDQEHTATNIALLQYINTAKSGTIKLLLEALPYHDEAVVIGLLGRLIVLGDVTIDLSKKSFGLTTQWHCDEKKEMDKS